MEVSLKNNIKNMCSDSRKSVLFFFVVQIIVSLSVNLNAQKLKQNSRKGIKEYYGKYFPIGVAVSPQALMTEEADLVKRQFASVTAENAMKMGPIHPSENTYFWKDADQIVDFARANGMKIRGHALCWHQQTPEWMFVDNGREVGKAVLLERLRKHITKVVSRYKGKIYAWDVVNEAIADDTSFLRDSPWSKICGEDFILKAFEYAHAADSNAILFYNDYNMERPEKREKIYRLLKRLQDAGIPVHGIGLQAHWSLSEPTEINLRQTIEAFSNLGLQVQITELDISVHPWEDIPRSKREGEDDSFTSEKQQKQLEMYSMVFRVFREYKTKITGVTFWNISDRHSWLDYYPINGRKNYPLLFDQDLKPKQAFWEVVDF